MKYLKLKNTDLKVSKICLGGDKFGDKQTKEEAFHILDQFTGEGGNFIDTANVYCRWVPGLGNCSEKIIGAWLKSRNAYNKVVISTKGGHYDISKPERKSRINEKDIRADLEESLLTLGMEAIDFYWLHRDDTERPIEEIIDILEKVKQEGKIRYYGLSNYKTKRLALAQDYLKSQNKPGIYGVSNQWSLAVSNAGAALNPDPTLVYFDDEEYKWHKETGVPILPYSSTAQGFFQKLRSANVLVKDGKIISEGSLKEISQTMRDAYINEKNLTQYEHLLSLEKKTGQSIQALSLALLMKQPFQVVPMSSVSTEEQLYILLAAADVE